MKKGSMLPVVIGLGAIGGLFLFGRRKRGGVVEVEPEPEEEQPGAPAPQAPIPEVEVPTTVQIPTEIPQSIPMPQVPSGMPSYSPIPMPPTMTTASTQPQVMPQVTPTEQFPAEPTVPEEEPIAIPLPQADEIPASIPLPQADEIPASIPLPQPDEIPASIPLPELEQIPQAIPLPVPTETVEQPTQAPADTVTTASIMLADEAGTGWKKKYPSLKAWQIARGAKGDGMFGPTSALLMAAELGTVPIVRYWPKNSQKPQALAAYREGLLELSAVAEEPRKSQLIAATEREQGQGFGSNQGPIAVRIDLGAA